jgi:ABC-type amino acid transport substrate-binding protein
MTRLAPLLIVLICGLLASACGNLPGVDVNLDSIAHIAATPGPIGGAEPTPTVAPPNVSTAALVKQRAKIRAGIRYDAPPLSRVNGDGELEGFDVDLAREFARRWLGGERNVEFVQVTSASAPRKIQNREVDLALGGLIHTQPAEALADFSLPYLIDGEAMLVRTGVFTDFAGMAGRNVIYIDSPSTFALRDAQIANNITVTAQSVNSYAAAVQALADGATDGVVGRWRRLRTVPPQDPAYTVLNVFTREPVAIMLPQNDSDWADLVNNTLSAMVADGFYAKAYEKWFGAPPPEPVSVLPLPTDLQLVDLPDAMNLRSALDPLRNTNTVRVGFNAQAQPFATLNEVGQPAGFEVDLMREMARRWFGTPDAAQFTPLSADQFATALQEGSVDLAIGGIQHSAASERAMDFSLPIFRQSDTPLAIALPTNASALRDLVNHTLQEMLADGAYEKLHQRWFPDQAIDQIERWPGDAPALAALLAPPTPAPQS